MRDADRRGAQPYYAGMDAVPGVAARLGSAAGDVRNGLVKLVMDLGRTIPLRAAMDDDRRDLVIRLCTEVGIVMEDMSPVALAAAGNKNELLNRLDELGDAIGEMSALLAAARVLARQEYTREAPLTS